MKKTSIMYLNDSNKLRILHHLNKFKKSIKLEKYLTKLQQSDAIVIFKRRTTKNFRRKYQDNNCPRCLHESDDEVHLISHCSQHSFDNDPTAERYKQISSFFRSRRSVKYKYSNICT